jgi:hypothetical protein
MRRNFITLPFAMLALLGTLCAARPVAAHGRYPAAQQVVVAPTQPNRLWLRATYGLLTSNDAGQSWDWLCHEAAGYGAEEDPPLKVTANGTLFVATANGLVSSRDGGCTWVKDPQIGAAEVVDLALEGDGRHLLALVHVAAEDHYDLVIYRSDADTTQFSPIGAALASDVLGRTIAISPTDPSRLYVTGVNVPDATAGQADVAPVAIADRPAFLLRSRDGGTHWERLEIPGASLGKPASLAAVHPSDPNSIYVTVQGALNERGTVESFLQFSEDGGDTWREIFRGPADLMGFVLSSDGNRVLVGLGDGRDVSGSRPVEHSSLGVYEAVAPQFDFSRQLEGQIGCLTEAEPGLFLCGAHGSEGFELGLSRDGGRSARGLLDWGGVRGPLACPDGSLVQSTCRGEWEELCSMLGTCNDAQPKNPESVITDNGPATADSSGCTLAPAGAPISAPAGHNGPLCTLGLLGLLRLVRRRLPALARFR